MMGDDRFWPVASVVTCCRYSSASLARLDAQRLALLDDAAVGINDDPAGDAERPRRHGVAAGLGLPLAVVLARDAVDRVATRFDTVARKALGVGIARAIGG